ncbi:MAG TPA: flippase-like domain-containing protein [Candidatus Methylomirabilis sp.]|nr:flippase-like domain-containing protein [Candidatus Methylomirabilis sp.]
MAETKSANKQYFWAKIILGVLLLVLATVGFFDRQAVGDLIFNAHWPRLIWAIVFAFVSLFFAADGFYIIGRELGLKINAGRLFLVGFVTIAINDLITSAGTAAFSLRVILLKKRDVSAKEILSASIFHSYFNLLVAVLFLPFSLFFLSLADDFPISDKIVFLIFSAVLLAVFVLASWIFFSPRARAVVINFFDGLTRRLSKKYQGVFFSQFKQTLEEGVLVIKNKSVVTTVSVATFFDWLFMLFSLWVCFWALGINLSFGLILSGFFVGIIVGFISVIPGGIGIQEGSMAGIYALLGVPFSQAIIAVLLFRLIYYVIPFIPALVLYSGLLKKIKSEHGEEPPNNIAADLTGLV